MDGSPQSQLSVPPAWLNAWQLRAELDHLLYLIADLDALSSNPEPPPGVHALGERYRTRYAHVYAAWFQALYGPSPGQAPPLPASVPPSAVAPVGAPPMLNPPPAHPAPVTEVPREPWFREFLTDHAIAILSYLGAFALMIATLLFEVFSTDVEGLLRFVPALGLDLAFLAGGLYCLRRDDLRIVGRSYLVIFAVLVPLVAYAAYHFLKLSSAGINGQHATAAAALLCSVIYAALAQRVNSVGYAALSLATLPIAVHGAVVSDIAPGWEAVCFGVLLPGYWLLARWSRSHHDWRGLFQLPAGVALHVVTALIAGLALVVAVSEPINVSAGDIRVAYLPCALLLAAIGEALAVEVTRDLAAALLAGLGVVASVAAAAYSLALDTQGQILLIGTLAPISGAAAIFGARRGDAWRLLRLPAEMVLHLSSALLIAIAAAAAATEGGPATDVRFPYLPLAFAIAAIAEVLAFVQRRRGDVALIAHLAGTATVVAGAYALRLNADGAAIGLLSLGVVDAAAMVLISRWISAPTPTEERPGLKTWRESIALLAFVHVLAAAIFPTSPGLVPILVVGAGAAVGLAAALQMGNVHLLISGAAITTVITVVQLSLYPTPSPPRLLFVPVGAGLTTAAIVVTALLQRRRELQWAAAMALSATAFTALYAFNVDARWYAFSALVLGATGVATLRLQPAGAGRSLLTLRASLQLAATVLLPIGDPGITALVVLLATVAAIGLVVQSHQPWLGLLATALGTAAWYWMGRALLPAANLDSARSLALLFTPLFVMYLAGGLGLRLAMHAAGRRWANPVYASAGVLATVCVLLALAVGDMTMSGWLLLGTAVLLYGIGCFEGATATIPTAALVCSFGVIALLDGAGAPASAYPLALTAVVIALFSLGEIRGAWARGTEGTIAAAHTGSASSLGAVIAIVSIGIPNFHVAGSLGALSALVATAVTAVILLYESYRQGSPLLEYLAAGALVGASLWLPVYFGATDAQAYVAAPGAAAIILGLRMRGDRRPGVDPTIAQLFLAAGLIVLLGTSEVQSLDSTNLNQSVYVTVLVAESAAAAFLAIGARSRALALGAGAGLALAGLRALTVIVQTVPLYAVFAVAAFVLLAVATALAIGRGRLGEARGIVQTTWSGWR
ncbi:MAG: hypothetical protein ACR2GX_05095 [Candidatus Dormibacteria bacterium]